MTGNRRRRRFVLPFTMALLAAGSVTQVPSAGAALDLGPCRGPRTSGFHCAKLNVPLDYSGVVANRVSLPVRVLRASGSRRGTIVMLAGGPGQAGLGDTSYDEYLSILMPGWSIVELNQRGTGKGALVCPSIDKLDVDNQDIPGPRITEAFADCAAKLGPNRRFYTSIDSARDIDSLRAALGLDRIAIGGVSYGTYVAQVYARLFPQRTERMLLDSVVPPRGVELLDAVGFAATRRVLGSQCAGVRCLGVTNDLSTDVATLQGRIAQQPIRGRLVDYGGRPRSRTLGGPAFPTALLDIYAAGDLDPFLRKQFPAAVLAGIDGDASPLLRLRKAGALKTKPSQLSNALFAATTCAEDVLPWEGAAPFDSRRVSLQAALASQPAGTFAPWGAAAAGQAVELNGCVEWPSSPFSSVPSQPLPDVPALLLAGQDDTRTPVEDARAVAGLLSRSTLVSVPHTGHSVIGAAACADTAIERFMRDKPVGNPCRRAPDLSFSTGPVPRSIQDLRPTGGRRGRVGKTISAISLTIVDAASTAEMFFDKTRFPGLRRGFGTLDGLVARLHDYSYIPGIELDGALGEERARLHVHGSEAADGRLVKRKGRFVGRLGGQRVSFRP